MVAAASASSAAYMTGQSCTEAPPRTPPSPSGNLRGAILGGQMSHPDGRLPPGSDPLGGVPRPEKTPRSPPEVVGGGGGDAGGCQTGHVEFPVPSQEDLPQDAAGARPVLQDLLASVRSENTRRAYERQWHSFESWCDRLKVRSFPAHGKVIAAYLASLKKSGLGLASIEQALAVVAAAHVLRGFGFNEDEDPVFGGVGVRQTVSVAALLKSMERSPTRLPVSKDAPRASKQDRRRSLRELVDKSIGRFSGSEPRLFGYLRVSSDEQAKSGLGLEDQRRAITAAATRVKLPLATVEADEGLSGDLPVDERPGIMAVLGKLKRGDALLVAKRDRVARDHIEIGLLERELRRRGVRILSAAGEGTEGDFDDPSAALQRDIHDVFAAHELRLIRARTKAALRMKRARGERAGALPFGFVVADDGDKLIEVPEEQEALRKMLLWKHEGASYGEIARRLESGSVKPKTGKKWYPSSVRSILLTTERHPQARPSEEELKESQTRSGDFVPCPVCGKRIEVTGPGRYACHGCESVLEIERAPAKPEKDGEQGSA